MSSFATTYDENYMELLESPLQKNEAPYKRKHVMLLLPSSEFSVATITAYCFLYSMKYFVASQRIKLCTGDEIQLHGLSLRILSSLRRVATDYIDKFNSNSSIREPHH